MYSKIRVPDAERNSTPIHQAFYEHNGSKVHKWQHYFQHYNRHLMRFRGTDVRFLEIGVARGGSLQMWRKYLGDGARIFGVDIDDDCRQYDGDAGNVRIGSQGDPDFLRAVVKEMGGVDVVLDDGSHVASHQRICFDVLLPLISPHGVYICEDTHTSYWRGYHEGGFRRRSTFIERTKQIIDDLHADFHNHEPSVPNAHRQISGIHFYNSMIVLEKSPQPPSVSIMVGS
jgi:23S rRNA U2552 (ribose-2'-O)-methylase RlmE/FtsJ